MDKAKGKAGDLYSGEEMQVGHYRNQSRNGTEPLEGSVLDVAQGQFWELWVGEGTLCDIGERWQASVQVK